MSKRNGKSKKKKKTPVIATRKPQTDKQSAFVTHYLQNGYNATKAAELAGYAYPRAEGARLLTKVGVRLEVDQHLAEIGVTREKILLEDAKTAFDTDIADYEAFLQGVKLKELRASGVDTRQVKRITRKVDKDGVESYSIELHSRDKALDRLSRALGLASEVRGDQTVVAIKQIIFASGEPPPPEFVNPQLPDDISET